MLHHVRNVGRADFAPNAHLTVSAEFLDQMFSALKRQNIDFVTLDEVARRLRNGHVGNRFVAVTFDDGYRDNSEIAAPILQKHNIPYTVFVATGLIEGTAELWWDVLEAVIRSQPLLSIKMHGETVKIDCRTIAAKYLTYDRLLGYLTQDIDEQDQRQWVRELAVLYDVDVGRMMADEMMTWAEIRQLAQDPLCTIGAHTVDHFALARLDEANARQQMQESADILEAELGSRPLHFAYPYGYAEAAAKREFDIAEELGFATAVTTRAGVIFKAHGKQMTALPRISINGHFQKIRYVKTLLSGLPTLLASRGQK